MPCLGEKEDNEGRYQYINLRLREINQNVEADTLRHTRELEDETLPFPVDAANNRADAHAPLEQCGEAIRDSLVCADVRQWHQSSNGSGQRHKHPMLRHFCHYPPGQ